MDSKRIYLQGLDYRTDDRETQPGVCRVLEDLYPTGDRENPSWVPVVDNKVFYQDSEGDVVGVYMWYRSNAPTVIVYLLHSAPDGNPVDDRIVTRQVDNSGQPVAEKETLCTLKGAAPGRELNYAQMGDSLVIGITNDSVMEGLYVASLADADTNTGAITRCIPFNLPPIPRMKLPASYTSVLEGVSYDHYVDGFFGFRFGWELVDGTIVRVSSVQVRRGKYGVIGDLSEGIRRTGTSRGSNGEVSFILPAVRDNNIFFPTPDGCSIMEVLDEYHPVYPYRDIIKGIAVLISEPRGSLDAVLQDAVYFKFGMIPNIFGEGTKSLSVQFKADELVTLPIFEEDALTAHDIYAATVASYNKMLLLANVGYDYQLPFNPNGEQSTESYGLPAPILGALIALMIYDHQAIHITWTTFAVPVETTVEVENKDNPGEWKLVWKSPHSEAVFFLDEIGFAYGRLRAKNYYAGGESSAYSYNNTIPIFP